MDKKEKNRIKIIFLEDKSLFVFAIIGIIALFLKWWLGLIILLPVIVSAISKSGEKKKIQEKNIRIAEAQKYLEEIKRSGAIPSIKTPIFLNKGEYALLEEQTVIQETRAVRTYNGGSRGFGFKIAKGVTFRTGSFKGTSESNQEWKTLDSGLLVITNQRLIFAGSQETRSFPIGKIISMNTFTDSIGISIEGRAKKLGFPVKNSYIWGIVINILRSDKDPLKLKDVELNFTFV